jgi:hypothetical protein
MDAARLLRAIRDEAARIERRKSKSNDDGDDVEVISKGAAAFHHGQKAPHSGPHFSENALKLLKGLPIIDVESKPRESESVFDTEEDPSQEDPDTPATPEDVEAASLEVLRRLERMRLQPTASSGVNDPEVDVNGAAQGMRKLGNTHTTDLGDGTIGMRRQRPAFARNLEKPRYQKVSKELGRAKASPQGGSDLKGGRASAGEERNALDGHTSSAGSGGVGSNDGFNVGLESIFRNRDAGASAGPGHGGGGGGGIALHPEHTLDLRGKLASSHHAHGLAGALYLWPLAAVLLIGAFRATG